MTSRPYYHHLEIPVLPDHPSANPKNGYVFLYRLQDGSFYQKLSNGAETPLIKEGGNLGDFPAVINSISPSEIGLGLTRTIAITGEFLTPTTAIAINDGTTQTAIASSKINYIDTNRVEFELTAGNEEISLDLKVDNGSGITTLPDAISIVPSSWYFLGNGGHSFTHGNEADKDIRYRDTMTLVQNDEGIMFEGENPFNSWVKFEFLKWNRGENKTLKFIFTITQKLMAIGIGSTDTGEAEDTVYYYEPELQIYLNDRKFLSYIGNGGEPFDGQSTNVDQTLTSKHHRLEIEGDGSPGSTVRIYDLPSNSSIDWEDSSILAYEGVVPSNHTADDPILMPFCVPRQGKTTIVAVQVTG